MDNYSIEAGALSSRAVKVTRTEKGITRESVLQGASCRAADMAISGGGGGAVGSGKLRGLGVEAPAS